MNVKKISSLRERKKADTRERLARAAVQLAVKEGTDSAKISDIAEAAGVSIRTFHNYFPRRDDAYLFLIQSYFEDMARTLETYPKDQPIIETLRELCWDIVANEEDELLNPRTLMLLGQHLTVSSSPAENPQQHEMFRELSDAVFKHTDGTLSRYQCYLLVQMTLTAASCAVEASMNPNLAGGRGLRSLFNESFDVLGRSLR